MTDITQGEKRHVLMLLQREKRRGNLSKLEYLFALTEVYREKNVGYWEKRCNV